MKYAVLRHRVARAEALVEGRRKQTVDHADALVKHWNRAWTPWRIIAVGLGLGFLTGQSRPTRAMGAARWLKMAGSLSGMFTSLQTAVAAWQAEQAAGEADDAADSAQTASSTSRPATAPTEQAAQKADDAARHAATLRAAGMATADDGGHHPAPRMSSYARASEVRGETEQWAAHPPRPAEAATDVSER
ncbi:hypothetical protein [Pseudoxanthomonas sp.]|uniref:hypothetical protein n=1 Tax=Pseudoxanthomonas sp. TaxID=1871049 RepID=UPI002614A684|nr:hypothetical protein [Pseudoxanthomonas sp.]WDS37932.1 MAG: hypothetical protein O8I58_08745 [Pseudoxanthomonas sp.]